MSVTLYRKYRPQTFAQVVNQHHVKVTLGNEILSGKIAHAYLFAGPHGVGKTTLARILAKALNCHERQGVEPCDQCPSCLEIKSSSSLDLIEIDAASNRGINEIRELKEQVRFVPAKEKYKVFIIDEAHMLSTEAFNALLKTLEEPPAHVIFVLATTEIHKVPETIISRCQRFDFKKVACQEIVKHLEEIVAQESIKVPRAVLVDIARQSEGYLRDAVSLLGQILALGEKEITEEQALLFIPRSDLDLISRLLLFLFKGQATGALKLVNQLVEEGGDLEFFTRQTIEYLRRLLLAKVTNNWQELLWDFSEDSLKPLQAEIGRLPVNVLTEILELFLIALPALKKSQISQLPLELAIVKIVQLTKETGEPQADFIEAEKSVKIKASQEPAPVVRVKEVKKDDQTVNQAVLDFKIIKQKWLETIQSLKDYNHSLAIFLKVGQPLSFDGQTLKVAFKYAFHWERIKEPKNHLKVLEVLTKIFGQPLELIAEVDENLEVNGSDNNGSAIKSGEASKLVEEVLEKFGGEVVE